MKTLRVKELADILQKLVNEGHGERLVLIPETDLCAPASYRTTCAVDTDDMAGRCVYLVINDDEEEQAFWESIYEEDQD